MKQASLCLQFLFYMHVFLAPCLAVAEEDSEKSQDLPDSSISAPLPADYHSPPASPEAGAEIRKYAIDSPGPTASNFDVEPMMDTAIFSKLMFDRLEYQNDDGVEVLLWDLTAWLGDDYNKLFLESEGEHTFEDKTEEADIELLYARTLTSFWDLRGGLRYDIRPSPERFYAVLGLKGLAPQWFELETNLYLSEDADVSADVELEYDVLLSQRLILQPRLELQAAVQDVKRYGEGSGLQQFELGTRLRYEISRKFAPYVGVSWSRKVGETANFAEREGEEESKFFWLLGVRVWF